jgi:lipopolysaccharide/colanic/teichoic acid biosynthesis glycosyltransferase
LTVEFVAESPAVLGSLHGTPTADNGVDIATGPGSMPFLPVPELRFPTVHLPRNSRDSRDSRDSRNFRDSRDVSVGRIRRALASVLRRVPRRTARQLVESAAAIGLLLLLSPLLLGTAIAIKLISRGPVLFRQERVGLRRQPFTIFKFRTMYVDNDDSDHRRLMREQLTAERPPNGGEPGIYKIANDPRVTPVGGFLRQFSIDELPQLWNVVRGEMSLVGPRPYVPWEAEFFPPEVEGRFSVRPGMTGLWQVSGRSSVDYLTALEMDVHYTQHKSLWLDLRILMRTAVVIFDRSLTR